MRGLPDGSEKMPRFLAQNYLTEALQRRRLLLERMLLTSPNHLEFTETYVHKGEAGNNEYIKPWLLGFCCASYSSCFGQVLETTGEKIKLDIAKLTLACGGKEHIEVLSDEPSSHDEGSDDDLFNEIDAAVEKCTTTPDIKEEFEAEELHHWCLQGGALLQYLMEDLEPYDHLSFVLGTLPTVEELLCRLKPKMVHDPLLDPTAQPHTYLSVARLDICVSPLAVDGTRDPPLPTMSTCDPPLPAMNTRDPPLPAMSTWETYCAEVLPSCHDLDPILDLHIISPEPQQPDVLFPSLPSPDYDILMESLSPEEMKSLILEPNVKLLKAQAEEMNLSPRPTDGMDPGLQDFVKLNDIDVSSDSMDSGIALGRLESPLITATFLPLHSPLSKTIGRLEPLPLPLEDDMLLLSPKKKLIIEKNIWEKEKLFDSIAALVLQYPSLEGVTSLTQKCAVADLMSVLNPTPFCIVGDMELDLPWDPVYESCKLMVCAKAKLLVACPFGRIEVPDFSLLTLMEEFKFDTSIKLLDKDKDLTFQVPLMVTDVPSMGLRSGAPPGYLKPCVEPHGTSLRQVPSLPPSQAQAGVPPPFQAGTEGKVAPKFSELSSLDVFLMLRGVSNSADTRKRPPSLEKLQSSGPQLKKLHLQRSFDEPCTSGLVPSEGTGTGPTIRDIELPVQFRALLTTVEEIASPLITLLRDQGLHIPLKLTGSLADQMKFFIKQQQKAMEGVQGKAGEASVGKLFQSCQVAACLYVMSSLADTLANCSVVAALGRFSSDCEKYEHYISNSLDVLKRELLKFQVQASTTSMVHPKLSELSRLIQQWLRRRESTGKGKVVVIVVREYPSLSGEIMDHLKSIASLKSCVFSLVPDGTMDPSYLETAENRLHHYDCLVMPVTSAAPFFPWEKATLLVEYEQPKTTPLFDGNLPKNLEQYIVLKTVQDVCGEGGSAGVSDDIQFTVVASNDITSNADLLQLLEVRNNLLIFERDYTLLKQNLQKSKLFAYADIIVDERTGILLRPLPLLSTDLGLRMMVNATTSLSLQYTVLWVILYCQETSSYQYGGKVPANLACLHASFAHYCPKQDQYEVKVLYATDMKEAAHLVRKVVEVTYRASERSFEEWCDRDWLFPELTKHERFLLSFPCLNSFSAQRMLHTSSLQELLSKGQEELETLLPWIPRKSLALFHKMCNTSHSGIAALDCPRRSGHYGEHTVVEPTAVDKNTAFSVQPKPVANSLNAFGAELMSEGNGMAALGVNLNGTFGVKQIGVNSTNLFGDQPSDLHHQQLKKTATAINPVDMNWHLGPSHHPPQVLSGPSHHPPQVLSGPSHHPPQVLSGPSHHLPQVLSGPSHHPPQVLSGPSHHPPQVLSGPSHHPPQVLSGPSHHPPQVLSGPSHHPPQVLSGPSHHPPQVLSGPSHHPPQVLSGPSHHPPQVLSGPSHHPPQVSYFQGFNFPTSTVAHPNTKVWPHQLSFSDHDASLLNCQFTLSEHNTGTTMSHVRNTSIPSFVSETSDESCDSFLTTPFSIGAHTMRTPSRAPVRSLDLFDSPVSGLSLQTHDRALAQCSTHPPPPPPSSSPPLPKSVPLPCTISSGWKLSAQDLKSFHFNQQQKPVPSVRGAPLWDLADAPQGKAARTRTGPNNHSGHKSPDVQVLPGNCTMSPLGVDHTLFSSPNATISTTDSVLLSPQGKKLRCEKVPGSSDGQTRLVLF